MIYLDLFLTFLKIGAFTFGGGYAMLPLIQSEVVEKGWLTSDRLIDFIAVSEATPGPFAINISTYIGSVQGGFWGALCATFGVVLPSFAVILLIARAYRKYAQSKYVKGCMSGLKPAVIGLIAAAAVSVGQTAFFGNGISAEAILNPTFFVSVGILAVSLLLEYKKAPPISIIIISAAAGIISGYALD